MGKMKTDSVQFTTKRSMKELNDLLRKAISVTRAKVEKLDSDPIGADKDSVEPTVAVLLSSSNFMGGSRLWGVQVYFYELGDRRVAELVAVGEGIGAGIMSYYTGGYFQLSDGKHRRDRIMAILTEGDLTVRQGAHPDDNPSPAPAASRSIAQPSAGPGMNSASMSSGSGSAQSRSDKKRSLAISPDGLDPMASPTYLALCRLEDATGEMSNEEKSNFAYSTFALLCETFADQRSDFPCKSELKLTRALLEDEGSEQRYIYQPYIDLFPNQDEALQTGAAALRDWVASHPDDTMARIAFAGFAEAIDDHDAANEHLYRALLDESRGADLSECLMCWTGNARSSNFDRWYLQTYGPRSADDPLPPEPQIKGNPQQPERSAAAAPVSSRGNAADMRALAGSSGSGAPADKSLFRPLSAYPNERKFAMTAAAAAAAGYLLSAFGIFYYVLPLLMSAAFLALIYFDKPMDSIYMAVLISVPSALSILSLLSGGSITILSALSILANFAATALYWMLYLKKELPQIKCIRYLGAVFLAKIIFSVIGVFSGFLTAVQLHYPRFILYLVLPSASVALLTLAFLAALYGTTKDQISGVR